MGTFCWCWTKGYYDKTVAFWCQICRDTLCASAAAVELRSKAAELRQKLHRQEEHKVVTTRNAGGRAALVSAV